MGKVHNTISVLLFCIAMYGTDFLCSCRPATEEYPLKLQPEFDRFDASKYLKNERLMRIQFRCLIFDGPCDIVGKWAKPRAKGALLGECHVCTKMQEKLMEDWFGSMKERFPEMYEAAYKKFVENDGKELSQEDKEKIHYAFRDEAIKNYLRDIQDFDPNNVPETSSTTTTTTTTTSTTTTAEPPSSSSSSTLGDSDIDNSITTTSTTIAPPSEK